MTTLDDKARIAICSDCREGVPLVVEDFGLYHEEKLEDGFYYRAECRAAFIQARSGA